MEQWVKKFKSCPCKIIKKSKCYIYLNDSLIIAAWINKKLMENNEQICDWQADMCELNCELDCQLLEKMKQTNYE